MTHTEEKPFTIDTPELAAWATDKVIAARERVVRVKANCLELIADAEKEAESTEAQFVPYLQEWAAANPPVQVAVCSKRPSFTPDNRTDSTAYSIFVWQKGWHGNTSLTWLGEGL